MTVLDRATALEVLRDGELELTARLVASSNNALYGTVTRRCPDPEPDLALACVYKPTLGERPLDDFPDATLSRREVAAHAVSEAAGWDIVPPTVLRDGPFGEGMVQLWIETDEDADPWDLVERTDPALRPMAVFDAVVNNADRKVGHILPLAGHLFGVDHGIRFAVEPKLRTVLWGWRGRTLRNDEIAILERLRDDLRGGLGATLRGLLAEDEVAATLARTERLLRTRRFPLPDPDRPAIPWPPF
ncbi:MAG: SCO1664 family protein [Candidatus Limnocylindrales bacterium]